MNNKEFIATLAAKTGYTQDESQKMAKAIVDLMVSPSNQESLFLWLVLVRLK